VRPVSRSDALVIGVWFDIVVDRIQRYPAAPQCFSMSSASRSAHRPEAQRVSIAVLRPAAAAVDRPNACGDDLRHSRTMPYHLSMGWVVRGAKAATSLPPFVVFAIFALRTKRSGPPLWSGRVSQKERHSHSTLWRAAATHCRRMSRTSP
jgi:hypothetical protein